MPGRKWSFFENGMPGLQVIQSSTAPIHDDLRDTPCDLAPIGGRDPFSSDHA